MAASSFLCRSLPVALACGIALSACGGTTTGGASPVGNRDGGGASGGAVGAGGSSGAGAGGRGSADASVDGRAVVDGGPCRDCLPIYDLHWGQNGGLVQYTETSSLGPCRGYTRVRTTGSGTPSVVCTAQLATCPDRTLSNIIQLLGAPEVKNALAYHTVFGIDSRPVDGQVLRIGIGADYFDVGAPCAGASGCVGIPKSVEDLAVLLSGIDDVTLREPPCVPPPSP